MNKNAVILLVVMIGLIVVMDITLFRDYFWPRLFANIGIVLLFGAIYFRFFNNG